MEILDNETRILFEREMNYKVGEVPTILVGIIKGNDEENSLEDLSNLNYYVLLGTDPNAQGEQGVYDIMIHHSQILGIYNISNGTEIDEEEIIELLIDVHNNEPINVLSNNKIEITEMEDYEMGRVEERSNFEVLKEKSKNYKCSKCSETRPKTVAKSKAINGQYYVMCNNCGNITVARETLGADGINFVLNETPEKMTTPSQQLLLKDAKDSFANIGMNPVKVFVTKEERDEFMLMEKIKAEIIPELKSYIDSLLDINPDYDKIAPVPDLYGIEDSESEEAISNEEEDGEEKCSYLLNSSELTNVIGLHEKTEQEVKLFLSTLNVDLNRVTVHKIASTTNAMEFLTSK